MVGLGGRGAGSGSGVGGVVTTGWTFQVRVRTDKADPNFRYYNYIYIDSTGQTDAYTRRARAEVRRTVLGNTTRYRQILRWREL